MRLLLGILLLPVLAACSTMSAAPPSASVPEPNADVAGSWNGHWTGTGIMNIARADDVRIDMVQRDATGYGKLVFSGTGAAEPVPWAVRINGAAGTPVIAEISGNTVTMRHHLGGSRFTADLKVSENGERMVGIVRGSYPMVGLVLTREPRKTLPERPAPAPQQQAAEPAPAPEPVAMVPPAEEPKEPEAKEAEAPAERPTQQAYMASQELTAVHFDFDKADLRPDALDALTTHASWLKENTDAAVLIEGHCDERGTAEYNLALGERRANAVREFLAQQGVGTERITTVSYGRERPACAADTTDCHEMNRRSEFRVKAQAQQ